LLAIAAAPAGEAVTGAEIARRYCLPHKFLAQILLDLKKAGTLESRRGKSGGYVHVSPAETKRLGEALRKYEGTLSPLPCLSRQSYRRCEDCVNEATCEIRREFGRAYNASRQVLDSRTIADALANTPFGPAVDEERRLVG